MDETVTRMINAGMGYGADPTGVLNSTTNFQAALDEPPSGGLLFYLWIIQYNRSIDSSVTYHYLRK